MEETTNNKVAAVASEEPTSAGTNAPSSCRRPCCLCSIFCLLPLAILTIFLAVATTTGYASEDPAFESSGGDPNELYYYQVGGYPVWSDDGSSLAGVEVQYNKGIIFPPLQGWTGSINPRYTVFVQTDIEDPSTRVDLISGKNEYVSRLFYMKESGGYVLVDYFPLASSGGRGTYIIDLDTKSKREVPALSSSYLGLSQYLAVPSRTGAVIAAVGYETNWEEYFMEIQVVFVNATTLETIVETERWTMTNVTNILDIFWAPEEEAKGPNLVVLQWNATSADSAFTISMDGEVTEATRDSLDCIPYPTTSGRVRTDDGIFLSVDRDSNKIVTTMLDEWRQCGF